MKTKLIDAVVCFALGFMIMAAILSFATAWHHVELRRQAQQGQVWY